MFEHAARNLRPFKWASLWVGAAIFVVVSAQAQNAMRAPLNIVPPAMQQAIGQPVTKNNATDKLAPRVAARQSKRAVRAVSAAPGSESGIVQVGQLGALQDAPIGLETGYGSNLWRGARLAFIVGQMARLPEELPLAALREAELKLHRSTTAVPVGTVDGTSWYAARLTRFLALGDTASVLALEALTGAVSSDPYAARAIAQANLGRGAGEAACAVPAPRRGTRGYADTLSFFMQLLVYCQLRAGEFEKAGLTLQLNEKSLGADKFYRELAFLMAAQATPEFGTVADVEAAKAAAQEPPLVVPSVLTPTQLALLQLAGYGITAPLDQVPPYFMQALAEDYAQPPLTQLGAALAAMRHGSLTAERFSQLSQLVDLTAFQPPDFVQAQTAEMAETAQESETSETAFAPPPPDAVFLALELLKVDAQPIEAQAGALATALANAQARGLWRDMVLLLDDRLRNLTLPTQTAVTSPDTMLLVMPDMVPDMVPDTLEETAIEATEPTSPPSSAPLLNSLPTLSPTLSPTLLPPLTDAQRAALVPALRLLAAQDKLDELSLPLSATAARLLRFGDDARPLENLIASLPDIGAVLDGETQASGEAVPVEKGVGSNSQTSFDNAPFGETVFEETPFDAGGAEQAPADTRPHPIADWSVFEAQYAVAAPAHKAYLARELAIYEGLGFELPEALRVGSSELDADAQRIQKLADNKWVGDLLLALVDLYGEENATTLENTEIVALLGLLRAAGLGPVAEDMAGELLLVAAGRLSLAEPLALIEAEAASEVGVEIGGELEAPAEAPFEVLIGPPPSPAIQFLSMPDAPNPSLQP